MTIARRTESVLSSGPRFLWNNTVSPIALVALIVVFLLGVREYRRTDILHSLRDLHVLIALATVLGLALIVFVAEYLVRRRLLSQARFAQERLQEALVSGRSVAWDLDMATGRDHWFGDLQTMFGIPSEAHSVQLGDFFKLVHPDDRRRVAEAVNHAKVNHVPYAAEFRVVHRDGSVRWVNGTGTFHYKKNGDPYRMLGLAVDITDRKVVREALIKSEEKFSKAFRESPMVLTLTRTRDHRYVDINETFEKLTGWKRDEVVGRTPFDIQLWVDPAEREALVKKTLAEGGVRDLEFKYRCKDGRERWGLGSAELIEIDGETLVLSATIDITDRKQAEDSLREKQAELAEAQRIAQIGSWQWDPKTLSLTWSEELYRLHGLDPSLPLPAAEDCARLFTPEGWQQVLDAMMDALQTGQVREVDAEIIRPDGSKRWVATRGQAIRNAAGEITGLRGTGQDVTERKWAEARLREYEKAVEGTEEMILVIDREYRYVLANRSYLEHRKMRSEEILGQPLSTVIGQELFDGIVKPKLDECFRGNIVKFEMKCTYPEIGERGLLVSHFPIEGRAGVEQAAVVLWDITERTQAEQALRESEERFRLVTNTAPVQIWMSGADGLCTYFNKRWLDFTGRSIEAELGNGWAEGVHRDDYDRCLKTYHQALASRMPFEMEYRLRRHDGEYRWVQDNGTPRFNADGSFAGFIGSAMDCTDRRLAQEALSSIGRKLIEAHEEERTWIGRELHDDINQRLALLAVELDRCNSQLPSRVENSHMIQHAQQRIAEITADVQALSHRLHSSKLDYLGLATAANSFCKELSQQSDVRIRFEHSGIARNLPREVSLCLFRVLQEALQNAVKHSGVRQFTAELRGSGGKIELSVTDGGVGFKEEESLTDKGIGLISMRERMQMIDGQLSIESKPGAGTTIRASVRVKAEESQAKAS